MDSINISLLLAGIVAGAAPIIIAALGETITEKAGLINLSLDGTILLCAMTAFATAVHTGSPLLGFLTAAAVGAAVASLIAVFSIYMGLSQVAVGFVLTLTARDLAYFWGNSYARIPGPQVSPLPVPLLKQIPWVGEIFFIHNYPVYFSLALIFSVWWYIQRTGWGLELRSVGEAPRAAFARAIDPRRLQLIYTLAGGALVGLAGAAFSLAIKPGWGRPQGAEGIGWIALALVIFGGWHPLKVAVGAYLFSFLQVMGIYLQGWVPSIPAQVFQVAPFPLMIFTLVLMSLAQRQSLRQAAEDKPWLRPILRFFSATSPAALGKSFKTE